jgi:hypothetical protein
MPHTDSLEILNAWRVASERAVIAEHSYFDAHLRSTDGSCEPPTEELRLAAEQLRAEATGFFRLALKEMARVNDHADRVIASIPALARFPQEVD